MRKTVIALLLVIAMLFVSCSPESKKSEETTKPAETTTPTTPTETTTKGPTAEEFLTAYTNGIFAYDVVSDIWTSLTEGSESNLTTTAVNTDAIKEKLTTDFTDDEKQNRYNVTAITSASGGFTSAEEGNFALAFTYDVETSTDGKTWTKTEGQTGKTGYLAGSCKITFGSTYSDTNISLNFNAYNLTSLPNLDTETATAYKDVSVTTSGSGESITVTAATLGGVALADSELNTISEFMRNSGS